MIQEALTLARRGLPVFPIRGKIPATKHGCKDATAEAAGVRRMFRAENGIGVATGHPLPTGGRLLVVDIDRPKDGELGGEDALGLLRALGAIVPTRGVVTGSGGLHLYFRALEECPSIGARIKVGRVVLATDWRGRGGYVVAPPSIHPNGTPYRWLTDGEWCRREIMPLPGRFLELIAKPAPTADRRPGRVSLEGNTPAIRVIEAALRGEVQSLLTCPEGGRHKALCKAAYKIGGYLRPWNNADGFFEILFSAWQQVAPGREREGERAIWAGIGSGALKPRPLPGE